MDAIDMYKASENQLYDLTGNPDEEQEPNPQDTDHSTKIADIPLPLSLTKIAGAQKKDG